MLVHYNSILLMNVFIVIIISHYKLYVQLCGRYSTPVKAPFSFGETGLLEWQFSQECYIYPLPFV